MRGVGGNKATKLKDDDYELDEKHVGGPDGRGSVSMARKDSVDAPQPDQKKSLWSRMRSPSRSSRSGSGQPSQPSPSPARRSTEVRSTHLAVPGSPGSYNYNAETPRSSRSQSVAPQSFTPQSPLVRPSVVQDPLDEALNLAACGQVDLARHLLQKSGHDDTADRKIFEARVVLQSCTADFSGQSGASIGARSGLDVQSPQSAHRAELVAREAVLRDSKNVQARVDLAEALLVQRKVDEAALVAGDAAKRDPNHWPARLIQAKALVLQVLGAEPNNRKARVLRAEISLVENKFDEAWAALPADAQPDTLRLKAMISFARREFAHSDQLLKTLKDAGHRADAAEVHFYRAAILLNRDSGAGGVGRTRAEAYKVELEEGLQQMRDADPERPELMARRAASPERQSVQQLQLAEADRQRHVDQMLRLGKLSPFVSAKVREETDFCGALNAVGMWRAEDLQAVGQRIWNASGLNLASPGGSPQRVQPVGPRTYQLPMSPRQLDFSGPEFNDRSSVRSSVASPRQSVQEDGERPANPQDHADKMIRLGQWQGDDPRAIEARSVVELPPGAAPMDVPPPPYVEVPEPTPVMQAVPVAEPAAELWRPVIEGINGQPANFWNAMHVQRIEFARKRRTDNPIEPMPRLDSAMLLAELGGHTQALRMATEALQGVQAQFDALTRVVGLDFEDRDLRRKRDELCYARTCVARLLLREHGPRGAAAAVATVEAAHKLDPENRSVRMMLAEALLVAAKPEEAAKVLPKDEGIDVKSFRIMIAFALGDREESDRLLEALSHEDPEGYNSLHVAPAFFFRAMVLRGQGGTEEQVQTEIHRGLRRMEHITDGIGDAAMDEEVRRDNVTLMTRLVSVSALVSPETRLSEMFTNFLPKVRMHEPQLGAFRRSFFSDDE